MRAIRALVRVKRLASVEDAPSAQLRGEADYPHVLMVLDLMEPKLKKCGIQLLKTPCYLFLATLLQHVVNDVLLFLFH